MFALFMNFQFCRITKRRSAQITLVLLQHNTRESPLLCGAKKKRKLQRVKSYFWLVCELVFVQSLNQRERFVATEEIAYKLLLP